MSKLIHYAFIIGLGVVIFGFRGSASEVSRERHDSNPSRIGPQKAKDVTAKKQDNKEKQDQRKDP